MASRTEERIGELKRLLVTPEFDAQPSLRKALQDKSNLVVAEAAKITGQLQSAGLIPELLAVFTRLFEDPVKADPKCWGKTAIVEALTALNYEESAPFLRAVAHVQMEPVWGGQQDAAILLRASAILGLVQCTDLSRPEILRHIVDLLADPEDKVRIEAVRTLEQMNGDEGTLLLRLKAYSGDSEASVIGQVFDSLLALERERAVDFVARFIKGTRPEVRDEAALALGGSRLPAAVRKLIEVWEDSRGRDFSAVLLRALSSSREQSALSFLLQLVREGVSRDAEAALEALELHRESPEIRARVDEAKLARETRSR
jgi:HEAT repeat protein